MPQPVPQQTRTIPHSELNAPNPRLKISSRLGSKPCPGLSPRASSTTTTTRSISRTASDSFRAGIRCLRRSGALHHPPPPTRTRQPKRLLQQAANPTNIIGNSITDLRNIFTGLGDIAIHPLHNGLVDSLYNTFDLLDGSHKLVGNTEAEKIGDALTSTVLSWIPGASDLGQILQVRQPREGVGRTGRPSDLVHLGRLCPDAALCPGR